MLTCFCYNAILNGINNEIEDNKVQTIGRIDIEIYRCVSCNIDVDEVIITDERIQHIKDRHPNDYEQYMQYMAEIIETPDYILESSKPNTAFILKTIENEGEKFELIVRLHTCTDNPEYKNSVITFLRVESKRYQRYLRTKRILYKRE